MADSTRTALQTKRCSRCKRQRDIQQFGVDRKRKDGLNSWCKRCKSKARHREWVRVKREKRLGVQLKLDLDIKFCPRCKTTKTTGEFGANKCNPRGLAPYCRKCSVVVNADAWIRYNETLSARNRRWREANRRAASDIAHRRWARQKSATTVPFTKRQLLAKWDYWGSKCWICGTAATSTDHVKPLSKGGAHMLCNLRPICRPCNSRKSGRWPFDLDWIRSRSVA